MPSFDIGTPGLYRTDDESPILIPDALYQYWAINENKPHIVTFPSTDTGNTVSILGPKRTVQC